MAPIEPQHGNWFANRRGFVGAGVLASLFLTAAVFVILITFVSKNPGRALLGDELYVKLPMPKFVYPSVGCGLAIVGIAIVVAGVLNHKRLRGEYEGYLKRLDLYQKHLNELKHERMRRLPILTEVRVDELKRSLRCGRGNLALWAKLEELRKEVCVAVKDSFASCGISSGDWVLLSGSTDVGSFWICINFYECKWKSSQVEVFTVPIDGYARIEIRGSIAMKQHGDPTSYPPRISDVRTSAGAREVIAESTQNTNSTAQSSRDTTVTTGTTVTKTPKYIEDDYSDLRRDFTYWKKFNDDGRRLFDRIMTVTSHVVLKFIEDSEYKSIKEDTHGV